MMWISKYAYNNETSCLISFSILRMKMSIPIMYPAVIGSEFINFLSTVATCRIIRKVQSAGLFEDISYGELMDDLSSAWR